MLDSVVLVAAKGRAALPAPLGGPLPVIIMPSGGSLSDFTAEAFFAHGKKGPIAVESVKVDRGPRRIIFVAENGTGLSLAARRIESTVIMDVLSRSRPEDSFALLTARGPRIALPFGSGRDELRAAAEGLGAPTQEHSESQQVLDAAFEAMTWLQPTRPGDSIFLLALNLEGKHHVSFSKVRAALAAGCIRVFGFQLGEVSQPDLAQEFPTFRSLSSIPPSGFGNVDHFAVLIIETGGEAVYENTQDGKRYSLSGARLMQLNAYADEMYQAVSEYYLLQLHSTARDLVIGLAPAVQNQFPWAFLIHPRDMPACSNRASAAPSASSTSRQILS